MNPDNYGSLPACKKLAEVLAQKGIVIETEAHWIKYGLDTILKYRGDSADAEYGIPAFSMAEVWRELREYGPCSDGNRWWLCDEGENTSHEVSDFNPTDALIELWIGMLQEE